MLTDTPLSPLTIALRYGLNGLGATPQAIADSLRAEGVTGLPRNCTDCPLAVWVRRRGYDHIAVTRHYIGAYRAADQAPIVVALDDLPNGFAIAEFLAAFDSDEYPDLCTPKGTP